MKFFLKKTIIYNFLTFFFSFIHIIIWNFFFYEKNFFLLKIYIFLFPISSFFFFFYLLTINKRTDLYIIFSILQLFCSIYIFFYLIIEYNLLNSIITIINFIFSYFMILFFKTIILINFRNNKSYF
ncbi:hypothetical protein DM808_00315 [Blattabacterium punctulatus]|uniref:Uncharacterized protein n=1 Tax=Blattabacterium punctulatus TaxID=164514 RepID=A0ABM6WNP3_9FLAO|nr:hypothetical protein DM808_00315 [Blattabacterium punctulatus]AWU40197.1 hypothetical protein DM805_00320 [Blattabacterium punctulatus]